MHVRMIMMHYSFFLLFIDKERCLQKNRNGSIMHIYEFLGLQILKYDYSAADG